MARGALLLLRARMLLKRDEALLRAEVARDRAAELFRATAAVDPNVDVEALTMIAFELVHPEVRGAATERRECTATVATATGMAAPMGRDTPLATDLEEVAPIGLGTGRGAGRRAVRLPGSRRPKGEVRAWRR